MDPPLISILFSHPTKKNFNTICLTNKLTGYTRELSWNFAFILLISQILFNLSFVTAVPAEGGNDGIDNSDYRSVCGKTLWEEPNARIIGGTKSAFARWPWMITIMFDPRKENYFSHKCGAALITENWAMTAAHCLQNETESSLRLRLGELDTTNEDEPLPHVDRVIQKMFTHPKFESIRFNYDLALMKFDKPVTFDKHIVPVCLPEGNDSYAGKTAYIAGWGAVKHYDYAQDALLEAKVPVITNEECEKMYAKSYIPIDIPYNFVCAGFEEGGPGACDGDSGGPLVVPREKDGRYEAIGLSSWGVGCGKPNQPAVYTRVSESIKWIKKIISEN